MKPLRRTESTSQSCSCTSCLYKSESEQPSIRRYVAHGSRIDRLYYGKYIPLRERKLLDRLVRTRAVYDDLRARLISESTSSMEKSPDLKPRKHHHAIKTLDDTNKSGAILELVDLVDKGLPLDKKKTSECCTCCSCSSKTLIDGNKKEHRSRRAYAQAYEGGYERGYEGGYQGGYAGGYVRRVQHRIAERHHRRGVHFKAKHIRSDPCTCTLKFSGLLKRYSKAKIQKLRPLPREEPLTFEIDERALGIVEESKLKNLANKSYEKYKESRTRLKQKLEQDIRKVNESRTNLKENVLIHARKSLAHVKQATDNFKKSLQAEIPVRPMEKRLESCECPEEKINLKENLLIQARKSLEHVKQATDNIKKSLEHVKQATGNLKKSLLAEIPVRPMEKRLDETNFDIKKDSIVKFRDHLKRKEMIKDWECDFECDPEECVPEECFKILKLSRSHNRNRGRDRKNLAEYNMMNREVKVGERPVSKSNISIQAQKWAANTATGMKKQKARLRAEGGQVVGQRLAFESKRVEKDMINQDLELKLPKLHQKMIISKEEKVRNVAQKKDIQNKFKNKSSEPSGIKFSDNKQKLNVTGKYKKVHHGHKGSQVVLKPSLNTSQMGVRTSKQLKMKRYNRKAQQAKGTHLTRNKSVSSLTTNSVYAVADKNKNTSMPMDRRDITTGIPVSHPQQPTINASDTSQKQAVRIGSTFSFNIEFYKESNNKEATTHSNNVVLKQKQKKNYAPRKLVKVKTSSTKSKYIQAKDTLDRCFCTLKLHKFGTKKKHKTFSKGTVTSFENKPKIDDKYVETDRKKGQYKQKLLPYECEPGICIPGECNPILCDKIIQMRREGKRRTRSSYTGSLKTRSTSSLASRAIVPVTAKTVQSSIVEDRPTRRKKEKLNEDQRPLTKINTSSKQAVRIGSSFSFGIEFYKEKPGKADVTPITMTPKITTHNKPKLKERGYQEGRNNKRNKSMYAQIKNRDGSIGTTFKRCFCTLKLYKKKDTKKEKVKGTKIITTDTQTMRFIPEVAETIDKGTKTKWKQNTNYSLLPYECEPYTCIPGECNPYLCLEKIKRRELHLRDYGVYTNTPKMRSVSSFTGYPYQTSTAVIAQPKLWHKGTNVREKISKELVPTYPRRSGVSYANSKQAVKIGSSFTFSVEFFKERPAQEQLKLTTQVIEKQKRTYSPKVHKDKGIKMTRVRAGDVNTQAVEARKVNKSSLVRPMLKRCFCTLNLQKKTKQQHTRNESLRSHGNNFFTPKMYTVRTAMATNDQIITHENLRLHHESKEINQIASISPVLSKSASSFLLKKYFSRSTSKCSTLNLCPVFKLPVTLKQPIRINSNFSVEVEFVRKLSSFENYKSRIKRDLVKKSYKQMNEKSYELRENVFTASPIQNPNSITGVRQYLERCFCTMNIQIANTGETPGKRSKYLNLKPYECEPGICVPGSCDPYECQKRIMKRLMRNVHKRSGTETSNRSISSYASQSPSDSRSTQLKSHVRSYSQEFRPKKADRHIQREKRFHDSNQKQAVRVGSTFSFNIEFSKNRNEESGISVSHDDSIRHHKKPVKQKAHRAVTTGAQGSKIPRKERHSQSIISSVQRGSNSLPMMKRCFCTLKLQKKGRMQREQMKLRQQQKKEVPSVTSRNMKVGTPKAKYQNIVQHEPYDLKPYECEPNICVPGECNPYECLEIMKNRKQLGVNTTRYTDKSISSMTSEGRYPRGRHKNLGTDFKAKKMHSKSVKSSNYTKHENKFPEHGSRQAVRIGSNFSFNIEFYKNTPHPSNVPEKIEKMQEISSSDTRYRNPRKETRGNFSQSSRDFFHRNTQIGTPTNQVSTMTTSFFKRCFCTAKLHGIENVDQHMSTSPTFMQRCFCALGLKKKDARESYSPQNRIQTADKMTYANYKPKPLISLQPYECEPGICIPGQCDPYVCDKIIQQRVAKQHTKSSETESLRTHSVSSSHGYVKQPRDKRTQAHIYKRDKQIKQVSRTIRHKDRPKTNCDKRVVRIGSNFSFNVEFYKDRKNSGINEEVKKIKTYQPREKLYTTKTRKTSLRSIGTESYGPVLRSHDAQIRRQMTSSGVSPILKRCFCTLKLLNKPKHRQKGLTNKNDINTKKSITKNAETQSSKFKPNKCNPHECEERVQDRQTQKPRGAQVLLPHECEPMTCIPGECNPEECLERIKRRQRHMKNYGTVTEYAKKKSIGSIASRSRRDKHLQARFTNLKHKAATIQSKATRTYIEKSVIPSSGSRQAVRIGSNFSFNIEFFKDRINDTSEPGEPWTQDNIKIKKSNIPRSPKYHKKSQLSNISRDADSQAISTNMQSTVTGMPKRCFCTLQLRNKESRSHKDNSIKIQHGPPNIAYHPKSEHSAVGQFLKKCVCAFKVHKVGKLGPQPLPPAVKYEIKGTSTSRRIARTNDIGRRPRTLEPYECEPGVCVPGECDPYECLKRIQKRQVRNFGTDYKRTLKDFGTDSIKGPVTKCTEAQCIRRNRLKSHGTSLPSKRTWNKEQSTKTNYISHPSHQTNRQAVRIGSNFSFNIEFFKDRGGVPTHTEYNKYETQKIQKNRKGPKRFKAISRGSDSIGTNLQCQSSQCPYLKRETKSSTAHTLPKRCFCTLQLQKKPPFTRETPPQPVITTEDKMTATKNKYMIPHELGVYECPPLMCIPGECNPYECLDKMKKRGLLRKSRNMGTRTGKTTAASVGNGASKLRTHKVQSNITNNKTIVTSTPRSEPQSQILKSPPFLSCEDGQNRQAVRIGSNFNFNVEFFKQKSQPTVIRTPRKVRITNEDSRSRFNKDVTAKTGNYRHYNSQVEGIKTKSQGSDAGNMLKRCFCTLQLQKSARQRRNRNTAHSGDRVMYPQTITVGRVTVEPYDKCYCNAVIGKAFGKATNLPDSHLKTVSTKIHKQYLQNKGNQAICYPKNCQELKKHGSMGKKTKNDMQTILAYTPSKFNKKDSKTLVPDRKTITKLNDQPEVDRECIPRNTSVFKKGTRLTAKKSKKSIPIIKAPDKLKLDKSLDNNDSFLCRCAKLFTRRKTNNPKSNKHKLLDENMNCNAPCNDNLISSKSERQPPQVKVTILPKKSKSLKLAKDIADEICERECPKIEENKKYSKLQSGDMKPKASKSERIKKGPPKADKNICPCLDYNPNQQVLKSKQHKMKVTFAENTKRSANEIPKEKPNRFPRRKSQSTRAILCYTCSENNCPLKSENTKNLPRKAGVLNFFTKCLKRYNEKPAIHSESAKDCRYCNCCKKKIDLDEVNKGAGDRRSISLSKNNNNGNMAVCPCGKKNGGHVNIKGKMMRSENNNLDEISQKHLSPREKFKDNIAVCPCSKQDGHEDVKEKRIHRRSISLSKHKNNGKMAVCPCGRKAGGQQDIKEKTMASENNYSDKTSQKHPSPREKIKDNIALCPCSKQGGHENIKEKIMHRRSISLSKDKKKGNVAVCPCSRKNGGYQDIKGKMMRSENKYSDKIRQKHLSPRDKFKNNIAICPCCNQGGHQDINEITMHPENNNSDKKSHKDPFPWEKMNGNIATCPCSNNGDHQEIEENIMIPENNNSDKISQKLPSLREKCCIENKPLFEMKVDSVNYNILNKEEITKKVSELGSDLKPKDQPEHRATKHSKACVCCICLKKKAKNNNGANITVPDNGMKKKPCICGSIECAKESKKMELFNKSKSKVKVRPPCVCGSPICIKEMKRIERLTRKKEELVCKCEETIAKRKADIILMKEKKKDLKRRLKRDRQQEEIRRIKRIKRNRELERKVRKLKKSSDLYLAAGSLVDVGKLGLTTAGGILRYVARSVYDPKVAYENLKCQKPDARVLRHFQKSYTESDAAATARRLKIRCGFMKCFQSIRQKLDEHAVTHFIMHIADKNPKTRHFKPKPKPKRRTREPLDFDCSLYMASLRRRPCLCVYYRCPWFYPHFITLLNVWKQFTDIMLFLLAAVVWSPCILCMEGCRALMCCFFCTG